MLNKDAKIDILCPKCEHKFPVTIGQVEREEKVTCPKCDSTITLKSELTKQVEKSIRNFQRNIKNISRKLK